MHTPFKNEHGYDPLGALFYIYLLGPWLIVPWFVCGQDNLCIPKYELYDKMSKQAEEIIC